MTHARDMLLLLCEDDRLRAECATLCRELGYTVDEADDSRLALVLALKRAPLAVVIGIAATQAGGFDACRLFACDFETRDLDIIALLEDAGRTQEAFAAGVSRVLHYPSEALDLPNALHSLSTKIAAAPAMPADARGGRRRRSGDSKTETLLAPPKSPALRCPSCGKPLVYRRSHRSGAERLEQWDMYKCDGGCGDFSFRHRTRTLSSLSTA